MQYASPVDGSPSTIREPRWRQTLTSALKSSSGVRSTTAERPQKSKRIAVPGAGRSDSWQTNCQLGRSNRSTSSVQADADVDSPPASPVIGGDSRPATAAREASQGADVATGPASALLSSVASSRPSQVEPSGSAF